MEESAALHNNNDDDDDEQIIITDEKTVAERQHVLVDAGGKDSFALPTFPLAFVRRAASVGLTNAGINKSKITAKASRALNYSVAHFLDLLGSNLAEVAVRNGSKQIKYNDLRQLTRFVEQYHFLDGCFDGFDNTTSAGVSDKAENEEEEDEHVDEPESNNGNDVTDDNNVTEEEPDAMQEEFGTTNSAGAVELEQ